MKRIVPLVMREVFPILVIVMIVFTANRLLVQNAQVQGSSMVPTLKSNDFVLVDILSYRLHPPRRGDIVILHPPVAKNEDFIKRVIGLPHELVSVQHGRVRINGVFLHESYLHLPHTYDWGPQRVPAGNLFVLGDNRDDSYDSHSWSNGDTPTPFVAGKEVIGRAILTYWPLDSIRLLALAINLENLPSLNLDTINI